MTDNFEYINVFGPRDHQFPATTATANIGTHKQVTFSNLVATPGFAAANSVLFAKSVSGSSQVFFDNNGTPTQLTGSSVLIGAAGYTYLPGNMLMQWNKLVKSNGNAVTFSVAFSSTPYFIGLTAENSGAIILSANTPTTTQFLLGAVDGSGGALSNVTFYFLAVGPA